MNTARFKQHKLRLNIGKVKKLMDQGITRPDEIAAIIKQPDYKVIEWMEMIEKANKAKANQN